MLTAMWNLSSAIRGYLRRYMPTNVAIDVLRMPGRLKWAVPTALLVVPVYLYATSLCATFVERGGPGWLNLLVLLAFWNAIKFIWLAILAPLVALRRWLATREYARSA